MGARVAVERGSGLRREWRVALAWTFAALTVALFGVLIAFFQVVEHYRTAATQLDRAVSLSSQLTQVTAEHESVAHSLWNGAPVDRHLYALQQEKIIDLYASGTRELSDPSQRRQLAAAEASWRGVLVSRGLFEPGAHPRVGVTLAEQQKFGSDSDQVGGELSALSKDALDTGARDIALADTFQQVVVALLIAIFSIVAAIMLYFARRITVDVVRPVEILTSAVTRLHAGDFEHRIDVPNGRRNNEIVVLSNAFNTMAESIESSHRNLDRQASHDALTGLANRRTFHNRLAELTRRDLRAEPSMRVLFIDIDDFKNVNDSFGHDAGDKLLIEAAGRLSACVRSCDLLGRLGGDEFAVLVTPADQADQIAARVVEAFAQPFELDGDRVRVTVSVGISHPARNGADPRQLLAQADNAMYTAKRAGKDRFEVFTGAN